MTLRGFSREGRSIKAVIICGPTGCGKSSLGLRLALRYGGQIINADSRQVYRRLDIGTAKPSKEDRKKVRHHMIDVADVSENFTAKKYAEMAADAIEQIAVSGAIPFIVGGAGLYLEALTKGLFETPAHNESIRRELLETLRREGSEKLHQELQRIDPESASTISPGDAVRIVRALEVYRLTGKTMSELKGQGDYYRPNAEYLWVGIEVPREKLYERINNRVDRMMREGLIDEIRRLVADGLGEFIMRKKIVGYYEIIEALNRGDSLDGAITLVKQHSRNYAKRQLTWFRNRAPVRWIADDGVDFDDKVCEVLDEYLKRA